MTNNPNQTKTENPAVTAERTNVVNFCNNLLVNTLTENLASARARIVELEAALNAALPPPKSPDAGKSKK